MKRTLLIIAIASLMLQSCDKTGDGTPVVINPNASIKCKIDGSNWAALTRLTTKQGASFIIAGSSLTSDALNLTFFSDQVGAYTLGTMQYQFSATFSPVANNTDSVYQAINGSASLTEVDLTGRKISGTFAFNAINVKNNTLTKAITEGTFSYLAYN